MTKNLIHLLCFLTFLLLCPGCSTHHPSLKESDKASSVDGIQLPTKKIVLDNGLTLIMVKNNFLPIFSYYTFVKVGSKFEYPGITGVSHFLEHLMFKGAKRYGLGDFEKMVEGKGGNSNAYTTMDLTVYHEEMPISTLASVIDLEADRMENLLLDPNGVEKERQVILEERKLRYENSPTGELQKQMMEKMFAGTPYEVPVIGSIPDIEKVSRKQIFDYFHHYYSPNNAIVLIVGDVNFEQTEKWMREKYAQIPADLKVAATKKQILDRKGSISETFKLKANAGLKLVMKGPVASAIFAIVYPGHPLGTKESVIYDLLSTLLGSGQSSYFYQEFVQPSQSQVSSFTATHYTPAHAGLFIVQGEMLKGHTPENFYKVFLQKSHKICDQAISERSLQKVKNQYLINFFKELQTNSGVAELFGNYEADFGDYQYYQHELHLIKELTADEVKSSCKRLFALKKPAFFVIQNKGSSHAK